MWQIYVMNINKKEKIFIVNLLVKINKVKHINHQYFMMLICYNHL